MSGIYDFVIYVRQRTASDSEREILTHKERAYTSTKSVRVRTQYVRVLARISGRVRG